VRTPLSPHVTRAGCVQSPADLRHKMSGVVAARKAATASFLIPITPPIARIHNIRAQWHLTSALPCHLIDRLPPLGYECSLPARMLSERGGLLPRSFALGCRWSGFLLRLVRRYRLLLRSAVAEAAFRYSSSGVAAFFRVALRLDVAGVAFCSNSSDATAFFRAASRLVVAESIFRSVSSGATVFFCAGLRLVVAEAVSRSGSPGETTSF
jgi:hypothetical protein